MTMVMNYLEFKRQLMVDPYDTDPAFIAARRKNPECTAAALASDRFEAKLQAAMAIEQPDDLMDSIQQKIAEEQSRERAGGNGGGGKRAGWLPALAAGLAMGIGLTATLFWLNNDEQTLEEFVVAHWQYDGEATELMARQSPMDEFGNQQILATLKLEPSAELMHQIAYARNCGTPNGNGVHMVVENNGELVTVMYIPDAQLEQNQVQTQSGDTSILMGNVEYGVMAVFGDSQETLDDVMRILQADLQENSRLNT